MRHDVLSDVLSAIKNGDHYGKPETITPVSQFARDVLLLIQKHGYVGEFELIDDGKGGFFRIGLIGRVNNCNSIRPRFAVKKDEYEKYERRFLPAAGVGLLIVSTSKGVKTHIEAKKEKLGGKLVAFVY